MLPLKGWSVVGVAALGDHQVDGLAAVHLDVRPGGVEVVVRRDLHPGSRRGCEKSRFSATRPWWVGMTKGSPVISCTVSLEAVEVAGAGVGLVAQHQPGPLVVGHRRGAGIGDRLRTATGISELRTFSVGAYPEISEAEPNNDFETPQPIPLGTVVNGVADNEDIDYFVVEVVKGQRLSAEVEGIRLGITHFDPHLSILDTKRFELATSDDRALVKQDGQCSIIVPEDGKYIIAVRESAYAGNGRLPLPPARRQLSTTYRHAARWRSPRPARRDHLAGRPHRPHQFHRHPAPVFRPQ